MVSKTKGRERESYSSQRSQQQMQTSISKTSPVMNFLFLHYRPNTKKAMLGGLRAFTLLPMGALGAAAVRSWSCRGSTGSCGVGGGLLKQPTPSFDRGGNWTGGGVSKVTKLWKESDKGRVERLSTVCSVSTCTHTHTYAYVHTGRHMHYILMYIHVWVHICRHICIQEDFDLL